MGPPPISHWSLIYFYMQVKQLTFTFFRTYSYSMWSHLEARRVCVPSPRYKVMFLPIVKINFQFASIEEISYVAPLISFITLLFHYFLTKLSQFSLLNGHFDKNLQLYIPSPFIILFHFSQCDSGVLEVIKIGGQCTSEN